ncbi:TlpA family protein disulfide reductase [Halopiger djelfimassiliensis]|uniref:TlpA family protein disulfide reductase n=1 Tax=Halopiger djelfimassiliensis TaxID=1293047 RepID=UPI00067829E3|nr:TlpA disulfide reductase family protein [Halopiger djelfimassiliensis]
MHRREALAAIASAGVVAGGGAVAAYGGPSIREVLDEDGDDGRQYEPLEIETVAAPGSEAGTVLVPPPGEPMLVDFFATWCEPCIEQMDSLGQAHDRIGDEVRFLSVTNEAVGRSITEAELVEWWAEHDGNWLLGLDPTVKLAERHLGTSYPAAVAFDADGRVQWADSGVKTADELVAGIEQALESDT